MDFKSILGILQHQQETQTGSKSDSFSSNRLNSSLSQGTAATNALEEIG